jgi:carbon monoxide dehydrogenase subunit G
MHLEGNVTISSPQENVWKFLTDPHAVGACVPGLESMDIVEPDRKFSAVASLGLGSVKVTFAAQVEWLELDAPNRAQMKVHGVAPGSSMDATSEMKLTAGSDSQTELHWTADVVVVGKIATLASRLMGGVTQRLAGEFFNCVKGHIEG